MRDDGKQGDYNVRSKAMPKGDSYVVGKSTDEGG